MAAGWLVAGAAQPLSASSISPRSRSAARGRPRPPGPAARRPRQPIGQPREPARAACRAGRTVEIRAGAHGHYYASAEINGRPIDVLVDSGASIVALTYEDAAARGRVHPRQRLHPARQHRQRARPRGPGHARPRQHRRHHRAQRAGGRERAGQAWRPRCSACRSWAACSASTCAAASGLAGVSPARHRPTAVHLSHDRDTGVRRYQLTGIASRQVLQGVRPACFPSRAPILSPTRPTSSACRSSSRPAFASTTRAGCSRKEINLMGLNAIGLGLATLAGQARRAQALRRRPRLPLLFRRGEAGADDRGCWPAAREVHDIGLALSPMAYFAQFALDVEGVAMVTASHNDNGWTGIKMGFARPLTFGPEEMTALKELVLAGACETAPGGALRVRARHRRALHQGAHDPAEAEAQAQGRGGLRQRHGRRLRAARAGGDRLRGGAARLRSRLHLPALQPQPRRHEDAARHERGRARQQGRRRLRLRRRRRPLRRGRQRGPRDLRRQGRRHAGARPLSAARQRAVRRRREIDRPVHDRSGARCRTARARSTGRPATPT